MLRPARGRYYAGRPTKARPILPIFWSEKIPEPDITLRGWSMGGLAVGRLGLVPDAQ